MSGIINNQLVWESRTFVMGILNVTPDSFSGDGIGEQDAIIAKAIAQTKQFIEWGADVIDVGGESTRPSATPITAVIEQSRVLPVIEAIRPHCPVPISIDTYRAETAAAALNVGADWVNDVWGLKHDPQMAEVVAAHGCPVVMMHNGTNRPRLNKDDGAGGYYGYYHYDDLFGEIKAELQESIDLALGAGVRPENIIIDPGVGFGKTRWQNLALVNGLSAFKSLGYPILLGTSRKGFIGHTLGGLPASERVEGTAATVTIGITQGANIVRVHDVKEMVRVCRMTDALLNVNLDDTM